MTADELCAFIAQARAQMLAELAQLDALDPATLPAHLRTEYEAMCRELLEVAALTDPVAVELHLAACEHAGRGLTDDEVRGMLRKQ